MTAGLTDAMLSPWKLPGPVDISEIPQTNRASRTWHVRTPDRSYVAKLTRRWR